MAPSPGNGAQSSTVSLRDVSLSNQHELDALRAALETGLSALEEALAHPDQSDSLERLILDLSRTATKEAEAATRRACIATALEADAQIANARAVGEAALKTERALNAELRRTLEATEQRLSTLEDEKHTEMFAITGRLEAQLDEARAAAGAIEGDLAEARRHLEAEQAAGADMQRQVADAQARVAALESDYNLAIQAQQQLVAELARERAEVTDLRESLKKAQKALEAASASGHETRRLTGYAELARTITDDDKVYRVQMQGDLDSTATPVTSGYGGSVPPRISSPGDDGKTPTRQGPRYVFRREIRLQVDDNSCVLIDLSVRGCQVLSPVLLKQDRVVRVELPSEKAPVECTGKVAWAQPEPSSEDQPVNRYRAAVLFTRADQPTIEAFIVAHVVSHVGGLR